MLSLNQRGKEVGHTKPFVPVAGACCDKVELCRMHMDSAYILETDFLFWPPPRQILEGKAKLGYTSSLLLMLSPLEDIFVPRPRDVLNSLQH